MKKGFAPILIVLIVLASVVVGVGGLFVYQKYSIQNQERMNDGVGLSADEANELQYKYTTPPPNASDETANPDPIGANWKTYTNSMYRYSIKYPLELDFQTSTRSEVADTQIFMNGENDAYKFPEDKFIGITIKVITTDLSLDGYLDKTYQENLGGVPSFNEGLKNGKIQKVTIDNTNGYKTNTGMQFENTDKDVWVKRGDYIYWFSAFGNGETGTSYSKPAGVMFDQILSTFKFTN
ncbi:MAG: PsbP-related protein [Patescibacteria group bacterium]